MSLISWLSSTPKVIDAAASVITTGMKGIDALFYTDEEKAEGKEKVFQLWLDTQKVLAGESSIRSMTRRAVALAFVFSYLIMLLGCIPVYFFDQEYAKFILQVAGVITPVVGGISFFFFGSYAVNSIRSKKE